MTVAGPPTVVTERRARRNVAFGAVLAVLAFAITSPMFRDETIDRGTRFAIGALILVAVVAAGRWWHLSRNPVSLIVTDDEIRLDPAGRNPGLRRIERSAGELRLAKIGSVRSRTLTLSSLTGDGQIPLHFLDREEVLDACHAHGWTFGG